ncbi:MAG: hypothetical protein Kow0069_31550 [Promethearchaeota archaeon]
MPHLFFPGMTLAQTIAFQGVQTAACVPVSGVLLRFAWRRETAGASVGQRPVGERPGGSSPWLAAALVEVANLPATLSWWFFVLLGMGALLFTLVLYLVVPALVVSTFAKRREPESGEKFVAASVGAWFAGHLASVAFAWALAGAAGFQAYFVFRFAR